MIKQNNGIKQKIIILIFAFTLIPNIAFAFFSASTEDGGGTGEAKPGGTGKPATYDGPGSSYDCGGGLTANCGSSFSISMSSQVYADMYDFFQDKPIKDELNINLDILAGTYIGLNVYEKMSYSISIRSWAVGIQEYKMCKQETWCPGCHRCGCDIPKLKGGCYKYGSCWVNNGTFKYKQTCPGSGGGIRYTVVDTIFEGAAACGGAYKECQSKAAAYATSVAPTLTPSYTVTYRDSNDIDTTVANEKYDTTETVYASTSEFPDEIVDELSEDNKKDNYYKLTRRAAFYYNRGRVCINVKTGKVRYTNGECESDIEYTIDPTVASNGKAYWKYFIPLNANSLEDFSFIMNSSGSVVNGGLCQNIIEKYDHYDKLIVSKTGGMLPKITSDMREAEKKAIKNQAKRMVENGCKYQTTITIPVIQRFYNELEDGKTFKGFNFYYKPIDIDNPFPNGLTETSLWYDWNESNDKDPDLTDSYDDETYRAENINLDAIRNYNKDNSYTSWANMNLDGTSNFISKGISGNMIIQRNINLANEANSVYPLGCGPLNTNVTNTFKQVECDKK